MQRIETLSELRRVWRSVVRQLRRDLSAAHRLATDPTGTFRELGYALGPEAEAALLKSLP